jgi:hypothetical protein
MARAVRMTMTIRTAHVMSKVRSGTGWSLCMIQAARSLISGGHGQRGRCRYGFSSPAAMPSLVLSTERPTKYIWTVLPAGAYTR